MLKGKRMIDGYDEESADMKLAKKQAAELHEDMSKAIVILCANQPDQNAGIAKVYEETYNCSLARALGEEFTGNEKSALVALTQDPAHWYAQRLRKSFKEMGDFNATICRIVGAHDKDEIKEIAQAYDDRYGRRLKSDIAAHCKGNYKRLAVAWVDLPDQLQQPDKLITLPDAPPEDKTEDTADDDDEEEELEVEDPNSLPDPTTPMYKAKITKWQRLLADAEEKGKARKIAYYRRLLCMYPPVKPGHKLLKNYIEALIAEYKDGAEGLVTNWINDTSAADFESAGVSKENFDEWQNTSEDMVKQKLITIPELKMAWGYDKATTDLPAVKDEPAPVPTGGPVPQMPAAPPPMPVPQMPQMNMMQNFGGFGQQQAITQSMTHTTTTHQQTIVQRPMQAQMGVQKMAATVPWGVYGGMQMTVNTAHGPMRVTVPPGYGPGSSFTFNVPVRTGLFA